MQSRRIAGPLFLLLIIASFGMWLHGAVPDVPTGQWLPGPALAHPREGAVSVALDDGRVLVIGGRTADGPVDTVEVFNTNGTMSLGAQMLSPRSGHTATKLPDGRVLVVGGTTLVTTDDGTGPVSAEAVTNSAEVFDVNAGVWYPAASLSIARSGHTTTAVGDGHVVAAGGAGQDGTALDSFEVFDPDTGAFSSPGLLSAARTGHTAAPAGATKVIVVGGRNGGGVLGTADVVDVATGNVIGLVLNTPRTGASATALLDGTILVVGGSNDGGDLPTAELIDPVTGFSMPTGSMAQGRRGHQTVLLANNNTVLITGGLNGDTVVGTAEQFIPWTGQFSSTGSPATSRSSAALSNLLLKEGVAWLAAGRASGAGAVGVSELYGFATLKTDKDDYPPGSTVYMTGSGWQPGERVTMVLHEVGTGHPDRTYYADADAAGVIANSQFATDMSHIGVRFYLTARGAASQTQITFTDAFGVHTVTVGAQSPNPVIQGALATYPITVGFNGNDKDGVCTATLSVTGLPANAVGSFSSATVSTSGTAPQSTLTINTTGVTPNPSPAALYTFTVTATMQAQPGCNNSNANENGTLRVNPASATNTTALLAAATFSTSSQPVSLSATVTSTSAVNAGTVTFTVRDAGNNVVGSPVISGTVASGNASAIHTLPANSPPASYTITAQYSGGGTFAGSSGTATLSVAKANQTITFGALGNKTYGDADFPVTATASSALTVAFASQTTAVCAVSGSTVHIVAVGTCTIRGSQAGDGNYNAAPSVDQSFTIGAKTVTGSFSAANKPYDGNNGAAIAGRSLSGVVGADDVNLTGGTATFSDKNVANAKTVTGIGFALTGTKAANYTLASGTLTTLASITPRTLVVTATGVNRVYDGTTAATVTLSTDKLGADSVTVGYASASFVDKHVGTGKTVSIAGIGITGGADQGNYTLNGVTTASASADITPRMLVVTATGVNRIYDGTTSATVTLGSDKLGGDDVTLGFARASFADKNVGTGKTVSASGISITGGADQGNYTVNGVTTASATGDITPKDLTGSFTAQTKVYDGTTAATVASSALPGVIAPDVVTLNVTGAAFDTKAVGTGKSVSANLALAGADAGNYSVNPTATTMADITPKALTGSFTAPNKVYDGTMAATVATSSLPDVIAPDVVTLGVTGAAFDTKTVGTAKSVSASLALAGADAGNYTVNAAATTTADITPKGLTGSFTAQNKVYDGTTAAIVATNSLPGVIAPDVVTLNVTGAAFDTKTVGTGKTVTAALALAGGDAGNYSVNPTASAQADITPKALTGSFTAQNKVYDGTTAAMVASSALPGVIAPDIVTLNITAAAFDTKTVGTGKTVTLTGATLAGADAGNYSLSSVTTTTADITPRPLVVSATGVNKVYDGTTAASVTLSDNRVSGDMFTASYTGASFVDKNVGNGKSVSASGLSISGADAGNYAANTTVATTADITPRALTVSATGVNKTYDGTTSATVTLSDNRVTGDVLSLAYASAAFADKHVGTGKTVSVSGISITGADAGNYAFNASASTTADIAALGLTGHFTAANKVYDGTTAATINGRSVSGAVDGDDVSLSGGAATFGDKNVANVKTVSLIGATLVGAHAGNYSLESVNTTTANITPKSIVGNFTASHKVYDGTTSATVTGRTVVPIVGDTLSLTDGTATFGDKNVGTGKTVTLAGAALAGSDAANYSLASVNTTTANITAAPLTITASSPADMLLHGPVPTITPAYTGFVTADNAVNSLAPQPTCSTNYTVTSAVGTYTTSCTGAVATNYTIATVAGSFKVLFLWDGFLQPINDTAHDVHTTAPFSKFKLGQTIPAKFDLKDANGIAVTQTGNPTFNYMRIGASCSDYVQPETIDLAYMPSSVPVFALSGGHYQYNWSTKGLQVGLYSIYANLADGTSRTVNVCFAK